MNPLTLHPHPGSTGSRLVYSSWLCVIRTSQFDRGPERFTKLSTEWQPDSTLLSA